MRPDLSNLAWYAIAVRGHQEMSIAASLGGKGFESFVPTYRTCRGVAQRARWEDRALFTGYVFCRIDLTKRLPILITPGVINIVGIGKEPVPVSDAEIQALQMVANTTLNREPWPFPIASQAVRVVRGPLTGVSGTVISHRGGHRLVLSVTLLQRSMAVEIDADWVEPVDATARYSSWRAALEQVTTPPDGTDGRCLQPPGASPLSAHTDPNRHSRLAAAARR